MKNKDKLSLSRGQSASALNASAIEDAKIKPSTPKRTRITHLSSGLGSLNKRKVTFDDSPSHLHTYAKDLDQSNAPYSALYAPSHLAESPAVSKAVAIPSFSADLSDPNLDDFDLNALATLPDAHPRQFLRNHLIMCRRYGLKFDGIGSLDSLPCDGQTYDNHYDIHSDAINYQDSTYSYEHVAVQVDKHQTFEFIGREAFSCSIGEVAASEIEEGSFEALIHENPTPTVLKVYCTTEEVMVFVLSQNGHYDKVFFDAGDNLAAYLNFLFTSKDMLGKVELGRKVALKLLEEEIWVFEENPLQLLNPGITSYEQLIHTYIADHVGFSVEPEYLFYFIQQGNTPYLFFAEIIDYQTDKDFVEATKFNSKAPLKPPYENYVDQYIYHIHENVYAVLTHTYNRQTNKTWNESLTFLASPNMVDNLQAIQIDDLRDSFMSYLQTYKVESRFVVKRDNQADLEFTGSLIGFASNRKFPDRQEEGEVKANAPTTRWTVLSLYQTKGGNYVCHQANHSINPGEHDKMEALVTKSKEEVTNFFGYRWLAKKLYESANFNANEIID